MNFRFLRAARATLLACSAALTLHAQAAPLNYIESVDGDLPGSGPLASLVLGLGTNSISGSGTMTTSPLATDFDHFRFSVPQGMQLSSIRYRSKVTSTTGNAMFGARPFDRECRT